MTCHSVIDQKSRLVTLWKVFPYWGSRNPGEKLGCSISAQQAAQHDTSILHRRLIPGRPKLSGNYLALLLGANWSADPPGMFIQGRWHPRSEDITQVTPYSLAYSLLISEGQLFYHFWRKQILFLSRTIAGISVRTIF